MEKYAIVEFVDGLEMIPFSWITEDRKYAYWPTLTTIEQFRKAVQKCISQTDGWLLYEIKRILGTADTYEKGMKKLKKAEFKSDINSESEDNEASKKSRKDRAKTVLSSEESFSEEEKVVHVPAYPKVPKRKSFNTIKQSNDDPVARMPLRNKNMAKIKYETDNHSTNTSLSEETNTETICGSINNDSDLTLERKKYEDNINLKSKNLLTKTNSQKSILLTNNNTEHDFNQNIQEKSPLSFETDSVNTSTVDFRRYIVRKLLDMDFKISMIHEEQKNANTKLDSLQNQIQTFVLDAGVKKRNIEKDYMEFFPLENLKELEILEQQLNDNKINRKALITQVARIGGKDIRSITFNILRRLLSDSVGSMFSYVGGKKKRSFFDLYLRQIIFGAVRIYFPEATEQIISEPIKSWLRHASERSMKKKDKRVNVVQEGDQVEELDDQTSTDPADRTADD